MKLTVNGRDHQVDVDGNMPLLWVLRDRLDMKGTKVSCGVGLCGACTVHVEGRAQRSCVLPVQDAVGKAVTTIEGLADGGKHPVVKAWIEHAVPQCGFCQSGLIMATAALLAEKPKATDEEVADAITNICRCSTYVRIRKAIDSLRSRETVHG